MIGPPDSSNESGHCVRTGYGNERLANLKIAQIIRGRLKRERWRPESNQEYEVYPCPKCRGGMYHIRKVADGRADPVKTASNQKKRAATMSAKKAQNALQGPQKRRTGRPRKDA